LADHDASNWEKKTGTSFSKKSRKHKSKEDNYLISVSAADFIHEQFFMLIDNINEMRIRFFVFKMAPKEDYILLSKKDWPRSFKTYFSFVNLKWRLESDGGGLNQKSRELKLTKRSLQEKIFSPSISSEDAFELIDMFCCLNFNPFCDIEEDNYWDIRCTPKFMDEVSGFIDSPIL